MVDYMRSLGHVSRENQDFLYEKARTIVNYYVSSDILPKNQVRLHLKNNFVNLQYVRQLSFFYINPGFVN